MEVHLHGITAPSAGLNQIVPRDACPARRLPAANAMQWLGDAKTMLLTVHRQGSKAQCAQVSIRTVAGFRAVWLYLGLGEQTSCFRKQ